MSQGDTGSFAHYRRQQQQFGNLVTPQQVAAARRRAAAQGDTATPAQRETALQIDWTNTEFWVTGAQKTPIRDFADSGVWNAINWMVRNKEWLLRIVQPLAPATLADILARESALWLAQQPLFRRLIRESLRRQITFPPDVLAFVRQVIATDGDLAKYEPWRDPEYAHQAEELQHLATGSDVFARPFRSIVIRQEPEPPPPPGPV